MKQTVLELVQDILSELDLDSVNSISDSVESEQIVTIMRQTYYSMMANRNWAHLRTLSGLESVNNTSYPNYIRLPDSTKELEYVSYNKIKSGETRERYEEIKPLTPDAFLRMTHRRNSDADNVETVTDFSGTKLLILNDKAPEYYTTFDDNYLVFDSYNSEVDTTLKSAKVQAMGYATVAFEASDTAYPDLPAEAFPKLYAETLARSAYRLNQEADQKAEQDSQIQDSWLAKHNRKARKGIVDTGYNYGRRSRK